MGYLYSRHLDRSRPLWELWFIEGLEGNGFAVFQKLHHCMMDGQAAERLAEIMGDFAPNAPPRELDPAIREARPGVLPDPWQESGNTLTHLSRLPLKFGREVAGVLSSRLQRRLTGKRKAVGKKPPAPPTPFNVDIGSEREFVFGSLPLEDIKRVKEHFGCTVNDVVLALVGSAMRDYLLARDELPDASLRAAMAVSMRSKDDEELGNKVSSTSVTLGTDLSDFAARLRAINAETGAAASEVRAGGRGPMEILQLFPPLVLNLLFSGVKAEQVLNMMGANVIVSNMRGSARPIYMAGARMATMYPMSIISPGVAINVTCLSYAGNVDFGITIDPVLVPQAWSLIDGLEQALGQYLTLAGGRSGRRRQAAGSKPAAPVAKKRSRRKGEGTATQARAPGARSRGAQRRRKKPESEG